MHPSIPPRDAVLVEQPVAQPPLPLGAGRSPRQPRFQRPNGNGGGAAAVPRPVGTSPSSGRALGLSRSQQAARIHNLRGGGGGGGGGGQQPDGAALLFDAAMVQSGPPPPDDTDTGSTAPAATAQRSVGGDVDLRRAAIERARRKASAVVALDRGRIRAEFWREESSHNVKLNCSMYLKGLIMLVPGAVCMMYVLLTSMPVGVHHSVLSHCRSLRGWLVFASGCSIVIGTASPLAWRSLRATKLERGVETARRLREKGFGHTRMGRSKHNAQRQRKQFEKLAGCLVIPALVAFIGMQVKLFSSASKDCGGVYSAAVGYTIAMYSSFLYQLTCLQVMQCTAWREVDALLAEDDENPALAPKSPESAKDAKGNP
jgi:hypothetical protein